MLSFWLCICPVILVTGNYFMLSNALKIDIKVPFLSLRSTGDGRACALSACYYTSHLFLVSEEDCWSRDGLLAVRILSHSQYWASHWTLHRNVPQIHTFMHVGRRCSATNWQIKGYCFGVLSHSFCWDGEKIGQCKSTWWLNAFSWGCPGAWHGIGCRPQHGWKVRRCSQAMETGKEWLCRSDFIEVFDNWI